jgi:DNA polymerase II large subunit
MGRPEKAAPRKMKATPHILFPVGNAGGRERNLRDATKKGKITIEMGKRKCKDCGKWTYTCKCSCGGHTQSTGETDKNKMYLGKEIEKAQNNIKLPSLPEKIKGVRGMSSKNKTPEFLEKGLLRAKNDIWVFKDGTARFDMTNLPLTHFRPMEIGVDIERLHVLGYSNDWQGKPLQDNTQIVELKCQDVIPSKKCGEYLLHTAHFIDDLLENVYGLNRFYNVSKINDLIGHLVVGLSPHTSAGALARIIGFTPVEACWAHPFYHAAKRRNCDGDEDALMLLMDVLINFSREYIPDSKGGEMDLPLILTTQISPSEVDKEVQNIDVLSRYPLRFYRETINQGHPKDIESIMDLVANRIATKNEYTGFGFTHDTKNITLAPKISAYKTLKSMKDKVEAQLNLATKIKAVDEADVARRVLKTHFLPDIIGNLNAFSGQAVRCPRCNKIYRRIPLQSKCTSCGGKLTLTVHEGSVRKYMEMANNIISRYPISEYTKQRILMMEKTLNSLFINEKVKIPRIEDFT